MRRFSAFIGLVAFGVMAGGDAVPRAQTGALQGPSRGLGTWSEKARLPDMRSEAANAFVNGKLYVMGGLARMQEASMLVQEWDPATDTWRDKAPMPGPLSHPNATVLNGKIYVVGGFLLQVHAIAQNAAYEYDPATDRWRALAPLKTPRGSIAVAALNGKIHAIGGRTPDRVTSAVHEVYDPAANAWTDAAPLPLARDHVGVAAVNGKIHIIGGRTNLPVDNVNRHDIYDPATNTWTQGPPLPTARSGGASALVRGNIVIMGGECNVVKPFDHVEAFNVESGQWRTLEAMPIGKHGITAATDGTTIYIAGGNPECGLSYSNRLVTFTLP